MCFDVLKNPVKAIENAKKKRTMGKTVGLMIVTAIVFGISVLILLAKTLAFTTVIGVGAFIGVFLLTLVFTLLFGLIIQIAAVTLGGKGEYYEGLTSITYALWPISIGFLIAVIIALIPYASVISGIILAVLFALGISTLYRSIKELFKIDMITSFVVVSIVILALFVGIYTIFGLGALDKFMPLMTQFV
jgi:hypothetical protein